MIALVTARAGVPAGGADEAIAEAGGLAVVAGEGARAAADDLRRRRQAPTAAERIELRSLEIGGGFAPARYAETVAPYVADEGAVVLPASPDGRDLAPRLAAVLGYPLLAGALSVTPDGAVLVRMDGRQLVSVRAEGPFVATLLAGSGPGTTDRFEGLSTSKCRGTILELAAAAASGHARDPEQLEITPPDPAAVNLAEAGRIVAAGAGLGGPRHVALLEEVAARLGASAGATRIVTDAGWLPHARQIGTTGVTVRPRCYVAFGISGAAQHVAGLGAPHHVIAVNRDRSCPMMAMADLALVTDAPALVEVLARRLGDVSGSRAADSASGAGR